MGREHGGILTYPALPTSQVNGSHEDGDPHFSWDLLVSEGTVQTLISKDPDSMFFIFGGSTKNCLTGLILFHLPGGLPRVGEDCRVVLSKSFEANSLITTA